MTYLLRTGNFFHTPLAALLGPFHSNRVQPGQITLRILLKAFCGDAVLSGILCSMRNDLRVTCFSQDQCFVDFVISPT